MLTGIVNATNQTKCVSLSNQKCKIQSTLINLHPNEYSQELHCNTCEVKLNKCVGRCSTLNDFSNKQCVLNNTKDMNIHVLNMITGKNQSII